jgi:hypothetical protein
VLAAAFSLLPSSVSSAPMPYGPLAIQRPDIQIAEAADMDAASVS